MKKLHSHFKSLSLLLLCMAATTQSMEPQKNNQLSPITWAQTYHHLSELLLPELMPLIFSLHLYASDIDYKNLPTLIEKSCESPKSFVDSVDIFLKSGHYTLVAEIFERSFAHTKVSICDIKDKYNWTVLHQAVACNHPNIVKIILNIAGDKKWKLLTTQKVNGHIALYYAIYMGHIEIVNLLRAPGNT